MNLKKGFNPKIKKISDKELENLKKKSEISLNIYKNFKNSLLSKIQHKTKSENFGVESFENQLTDHIQKFDQKIDRKQNIGKVIMQK